MTAPSLKFDTVASSVLATLTPGEATDQLVQETIGLDGRRRKWSTRVNDAFWLLHFVAMFTNSRASFEWLPVQYVHRVTLEYEPSKHSLPGRRGESWYAEGEHVDLAMAICLAVLQGQDE